MTVLDLIKAALRKIRVYGSGETPSAEDSTDCLQALNLLIGQWNNEGLTAYNEANATFSSSGGVPLYTIGTAGTWVADRPMNILNAYVRVDGDDTQLRIITSQEYNQIDDKSLQSVPDRLYYLPSYPLGTVYLWPVPDAAYTIGLRTRSRISTALALDSTISWPDGYTQALIYALAVQIAPEFGKDAGNIVGLAVESKAAIKRTNFRPQYLACDDGLVDSKRSDIFVGR